MHINYFPDTFQKGLFRTLLCSCFLSVLIFSTQVLAGPSWTGTTGDGLWTTNLNWDTGVAPATGSTPIVRTAYYTNGFHPTFTAGMTGNYNQLIVGYPDVLNANPEARLDVTGGSMTTGSLWISFGFSSPYKGVINMSGGSINATSEIRIGYYGATGTLNMTGGTLTTPTMMLGPDGGSGIINLSGGTIDVGYLGIYPLGTVDVSGTGKIIVNDTDGSKAGVFEGYAASNQLTGNHVNDDSQLVISWNGVNKTTVTAIIDQALIAHNPFPDDNSTNVYSQIVVLKWLPGQGALHHDVYFGTDYNAVAAATRTSQQYMGMYDVNSFDTSIYDPCGLEIGKTYYWRIDEVYGSVILPSQVWRFTPTRNVTDGYSCPSIYLPKDFNSIASMFLDGGTRTEDVVWQAENFHYIGFEQVQFNNKAWVQLRFNRKTSDTPWTPWMHFLYRSRISPQSFSLRIFNNSTLPITVSSTEGLATLYVISAGQERYLTFPITSFAGIVVHNTSNETEYKVLLSDLKLEYPVNAGLQISSLNVPAGIIAGQNITAHISATGVALDKVLDLEFRHDPWVIWRLRLTGAEISALKNTGSCDISRTVPWYLPTGDASVGLVADGKRVSYAAEVETSITNGIMPQLPIAERRMYNGRPTFFLNNQPYNWCGYCLTPGSLNPGAFMEFGASGTNLFLVETSAGQHFNTLLGCNWFGGDQYDFGKLEQDVSTELQANPNAYIMIRTTLRLPSFWYKGNETSQVLVRTDLGDLVWKEEGYKAASLASDSWVAQQEIVFRKLIQFCKAQPWASRVVAFSPACETTSEWFAWAVNDGFYSDYSATNENGFQDWCSQNGITLPRIPDPSVRQRTGYDLFPADTNGKWAAAYNKYYTEVTTDTINYFASVVKDETGGRSLVGALYAYLLQLSGENRQSLAGQLGFRSIIDNPNIDFISGIPNWWFRNLTGPNAYDCHISATESIQAAGKLYVNENDLFSWLMVYPWSGTLWDTADPRGGAISMHRRVIAHDMVTGTSAEWFSLDPSWHHDTALQAEFANQIKLHEDSLKYDRTPTEEVAFVVDDTTFTWTTPSTTFPGYTNNYMLSALAHTGAPVGVWVLSDLDKLPARIKVVVIAQAQAALPADITKLQNLINAGGRTIIVIGMPGLINPLTQQWNTSAPATITGLPIVVQDALLEGSAYLVSNGQQLYSGPSVRPRPYLNATGTIRYAGTPTVYAGGERPLSNNGRLIWCGVPPHALVSLLRVWLSSAGVYFYTPSNNANYFVYASKELVSITSTASTNGQITLTWPTPSVVTDLFDGWRASGTSFTCPFNYGQTRLFVVKPLRKTDINIDGEVDWLDFSIFLNSWLSHSGEPAYNSKADFNNDNKIDFSDFAALAADWQK